MNDSKMLHAVIHPLHPRKEFRISRAVRREVENVFVQVTGDGVQGFGEASPNGFYGESAADVLARIEAAKPLVAGLKIESVDDIERAWNEVWRVVAPSRAAQCALDLALWDWLAKQIGIGVNELALRVPPKPINTFCTIGISDPSELDEKIAEMEGFSFIKLKMPDRVDLESIRAVRERTGAVLAVDANCAWSGVDIAEASRTLSKLGVVFIEQPLHPSEDARMAGVSTASELPILADESCVILSDVDRLAGHFAGFNIKLVKCGGLTPALAMWRRGRELGLHTMAGCMLESSLLIAAGAVVAQQTEYADLDGAWLLRDDPFTGLPPLRNGILTPCLAAGFGVEPVAELRLELERD